MAVVVHLLRPPPPPCHAAPPATTLPVSNGRLFLRPFVLPGLKVQQARMARRRLAQPRCAAAGGSPPSEPSPEEEPGSWYRRHNENMRRFEEEYRAALRARYGGSSEEDMVAELEDTLFSDERDQARSYGKKILSNNCNLYRKSGKRLAFVVCFGVLMAMRMSAKITAHARLRVDGSDEISVHTIEQIVRSYVPDFLKFLEDVWSRNVESDSRIFSFLGALSGLAAISHIMFEDALAAVNTSEQISSNYSPERDVEAPNHELQRKMRDLERKFMAASKTSEAEAYEVMEIAGRCFRRVASQAKNGYVLAQNVRDGAFALLYLYDHTIAAGGNEETTPAVPDAAKAVALNEVPADVPDVEAYFKATAHGLAILVGSVDGAFRSKR